VLQVISDFEQVCKQKGIKSEYLFCTPTGEMIHPRVIRNKWQEWREAHGINITLHELRHTYITYSRLRTNIKLEDLKSGYGHAKAMDTDGTYVHDIELSLPEEKEKLEKDTAIASEINNAFSSILTSVPLKATLSKKQKSL